MKHKKTVTKAMSLFLAMALLVLSVPSAVLAAITTNQVDIYRMVGVGNKFTLSQNYGGRLTQGKEGQFDDILVGNRPDSNGYREEAYCLEFMVPSGQHDGVYVRTEVSEASYSKLSATQKKLINLAISFGYNRNTKNNASWEGYSNQSAYRWATQGMIWAIVEGCFDSSTASLTTKEAALVADYQKSGFSGLTAAYTSLKAKVVNFEKIPSFSAKSIPAAPTHTLTYNSSNGMYETTLTDSNGVNGNWTFTMSGVTLTKSGNQLKVSTSRTDLSNVTANASKTIETSASGVVSGDVKYYTHATYQDVCFFEKGTPDPINAYFKLEVSSGNLKITKTSEDNIVSGIGFTISGNGVNKTVTTGSDGTVTTNGLAAGTYTVTESTPARYNAQTAKSVTVNAGQTASVTFNNTLKRGTLKITKTSEDKIVSGIEFTITGNGVNRTVTTGADGSVSVSNLLPGSYTVTEKAYNRYVAQTAQTVTAIADQTVTAKFDNKLKRGDLKVTKTSEDGKVSGMKFQLTGTAVNGDAINLTVSTNASGVAEFKNVLVGTGYTIKEIDVPARYEPPANQTVSITEGGTAAKSFHNKLKRGDLKVTKTSEDNKVSGMQFQLTGTSLSGESVNLTATTNASGVAEFKDVLIGSNYTIKEINTPDRYEVPASQTAAIEWDKVTNKAFYNKLKRGDLKVTKTSEDGLVSGMQFRLTGTALAGDTINLTATTNASGVAEFKDILISGSTPYTIQEINTPVRYVVPAKQTAPIEWNKVTNRSFHNVLKKWNLSVTKTDIETGARAQGDASLDGAVYGIYQDNKLVDSYTTAGGGKFTTKTYICGENYTLQEITPPEGYLLDETVYKIGAEPGNFTVEINPLTQGVKDQVIQGDMTIIKHNDDGSTQIETPEFGAVFEVYLAAAGSYDKALASERDILTTDEHGYAKSKKLPYGAYQVVQTKGNEGAELMKPFTVFISENGKTYRYLINNATFEALIRIVKVNKETGKTIPAAGTGFKVRDKATGQWIVQHINYPTPMDIDTYYTADDGTLMMPSPLPFGNYEIVEVQAPYGYVLDSTPVPFKVDGTVEIVTTTMSNLAQKGIIHIYKEGEVFATVTQSGDIFQPVYEVAGLPGAVYQIIAQEDIVTPDGTVRAKQGAVVDTITTDNTGHAKSKELYLGKYEVKEITAPHGYTVNKEVHDVELIYAGQDVKLTRAETGFHNERQKVAFDLEKALEQDTKYGIGMHGEYVYVTFGLFAKETLTAADGSVIPANGLIEYVSIDANGHGAVQTDLPLGKYYLKEISTDEHYILNDTPYDVDFDYAGQDVSLVEQTANGGSAIHNTIQRGEIEGMKIDEYDAPLGMAVIGIFRPDETEFTLENAIYTDVSKPDGTWHFDNVPYGTWLITEIEAPTGYVLQKTPIQVIITEDGQIIPVTMSNRLIRGDFAGIKKDEDGNNLAGATIGLFAADEIEFTEETALMLTVSDDNGAYRFANVIYGDYLIREIEAPTGFVLTETTFAVSIRADGVTVEVADIINYWIRGDIAGIKKDEDGNNLAGATIGLFAADETVFTKDTALAWTVTGDNGAYLFESVRYGDYLVREIEAPTGFVLTETTFAVSIRADGATVEVEDIINNWIRGDIAGIKKDEDGKNLAGATIGLFAADETKFTKDTALAWTVTDENGTYLFESVRYGDYKVAEIEAPTGFVLTETTFSVSIREDGATVEVEDIINNWIRGNIAGVKKDEDGNALAGATIGLFAADKTKFTKDNALAWVVTDKNGVFSFENVRYGDYKIAEIEAPTGFVLTETVYDVSVRENGATIEVADIINRWVRGRIEGVKTDTNGKPLAGAVIGLFPAGTTEFSKKNAIQVVTSDKNGAFAFENVRYGEYVVREIEAPKGYLLSDAQFPVRIVLNGQTIKIQIENELATGSLELTKKDVSTGELLPNTGVQILDENKNVIFEGRTDENGVVRFDNLPIGKYYYRELDAPGGYTLDTRAFPFEIKYGGEIVKAVMTNAKIGVPETTQPTAPHTGQESHVAVWALMLVTAVVALAVLTLRKKETGSEV